MNGSPPAPAPPGRPWLWAWIVGAVFISGLGVGEFQSCRRQLGPGPGEAFYEGVGGLLLLGGAVAAILVWGLVLALARALSRWVGRRRSPD